MNKLKDIYFSDNESNEEYTPRRSTRQPRPTQYEDVYSDSSRAPGYEDIPMNRRQMPQSGGGNGERNGGNRRPPMEDISSGAKKKPRKKRKGCGCGCFTSVIAFFLIAVGVLGFAGYNLANKLFDEINFDDATHSNVFVNEDDLYKSDDVTNILLIGVDRRNPETASRSDTMMLLSIDKANKKIKLTSFMRDMWVDIPGEGYAKINSACVWGGPQLVMDTIEYNFNVDIDSYMLVDFDMFIKIVDGLGGVQVEVTEKEAAFFGSGSKYAPPMKIEAGTPTLNGEEALWYCRIRYLDDDFRRTERQRKVISAVIKKVAETNPAELYEIAKSVMPYVETNMGNTQLMKLAAGTVASYMRYDIEQHTVPADNTWKYGTRKGLSVILIDAEENEKALYDFLYTADEEESSSDETQR